MPVSDLSPIPYDHPERDISSHELWQRSLRRSRHRREIAERTRRPRARRKAASVATAATMIATPAVPRTVGATDVPGGSGAPRSLCVAAEGRTPAGLAALAAGVGGGVDLAAAGLRAGELRAVGGRPVGWPALAA